MFQKDTQRFGASSPTDSLITETHDATYDLDQNLTSHALGSDSPNDDDGPPRLDSGRPSRIRSHPFRLSEFIAHLSSDPHVFFTA
jgi:hypothetical protein